nr:MAG TPA: hypothetical protein [Caudoviricetes sp.]
MNTRKCVNGMTNCPNRNTRKRTEDVILNSIVRLYK